jgi:hypothetical protein
MKKQQIKLSLFSIIIFGLLFSSMQFLVPVDGLADEFYPVTPCRIADSRSYLAPHVQGEFRGPFDVGETICYKSYGGGPFDIGPQGGNTSGCWDPWQIPWDEEASGIHVNITAIPTAGRGHIKMYPADAWQIPKASVMSWDNRVGNISNAVSSMTYEEWDPDSEKEFCLTIGGYPGGRVHIAMDIMGYYYAP